MNTTNEAGCQIPFTADSTVEGGFRVRAALGGGRPHTFQVDTGSVGILTPRSALGPDFQDFDPSKDVTFGFVSSGHQYHGQWVNVPIAIGVPASWDGTGDFPLAQLEVFAVDQPTSFNHGIFGIGFAIGGMADGGPERNPLLHVKYKGMQLSSSYIVSTKGIEVGPGPLSTKGFAFIRLDRNAAGNDWRQPLGSVQLTGNSSPDHFSTDLPFLVDTGLPEMILWLSRNHAPLNLPGHEAFPSGIMARVSAPPANWPTDPALQYSFLTGDKSQPMAPSHVEWRVGHGINTGRMVLAGSDYLYDAMAGRIGFRAIAA
jgi:hypothetical protein